jgi:transaldolase
MSTVITDKKRSYTKLNELEQLKKFTTVVADTADFESIREFKPQDATTNPSLVYAATQKLNYNHLLEEVLIDRRNSGLWGAAQIKDIVDHLLVPFGCAMLAVVPGRVSTETDASFPSMYKIRSGKRNVWSSLGVGCERVLIKVASTMEGSWRRNNCRGKESNAI